MMTATAAKERPILFSAPMVRAILDGRKTQTRRALPMNGTGVDNPALRIHEGVVQQFVSAKTATAIYGKPHDGGWITCVAGAGKRGAGNPLRCPYGEPGDRLWVREAFSRPVFGDCTDQSFPLASMPVAYRADVGVEVFAVGRNWTMRDHWCKWHPSIHMPRELSRITLEITDVRVQRLMQIDDKDALAEGVASDRQRDSTWYGGKGVVMFRSLWESINGLGSWDATPWVWAITFKRLV